MPEILAEGGPGNLKPDVALALDHLALHRRRQRAHRGSLAEDFEGDTLAHIALGAGVNEEGLGRPGQGIDESRSDSEAARIELHASSASDVADTRDPFATNGDIDGRRVRAAAVEHGSAADD